MMSQIARTRTLRARIESLDRPPGRVVSRCPSLAALRDVSRPGALWQVAGGVESLALSDEVWVGVSMMCSVTGYSDVFS